MSKDISDALGGDFDPSAIEQRTHEVLPPGWYACEVDAASVRDTKAGTGKYLKLELTVLDEPHAGRKLFGNINLANPNPQAVEIGQRDLAALAVACGISALKDSAELLQKQIGVKVKAKRDNPDENDVCGFRALSDKPAAAAPANATAKPAPKAAPAAGPAKRPWER